VVIFGGEGNGQLSGSKVGASLILLSGDGSRHGLVFVHLDGCELFAREREGLDWGRMTKV